MDKNAKTLTTETAGDSAFMDLNLFLEIQNLWPQMTLGAKTAITGTPTIRTVVPLEYTIFPFNERAQIVGETLLESSTLWISLSISEGKQTQCFWRRHRGTTGLHGITCRPTCSLALSLFWWRMISGLSRVSHVVMAFKAFLVARNSHN